MPAEPSAKGSRRSVRIGPYAVEAPLTLGSLGSVYRAKSPNGGQSVALKVLPPELSGSIAARDRFQREAARAKKVRSPHVVNVLDFGDASGTWYLAMELVEGASLAEHVQSNGALDGDTVRDVLVQIAETLALLHREGLVPRDVSAENFRVSSSGDDGRLTVKLLDIGLLRPPNEEAPNDLRTAIGSLGATAYFLLTGRKGKPDLGALGDSVSDEFRMVLRRLVGQRAEERYATPAALLEALGEDEPESSKPAEEAAEPEVDPLAALAEQMEEEVPKPRRAAAPKKPARRRDEDEEEEEHVTEAPAADFDESDTNGEEDEDEDMPAKKARAARPAAGIPKGVIWGGGAFVVALIVGIIIWAAVGGGDKGQPTGQQQAHNPNNGQGPNLSPSNGGGGDSSKREEKPADPKNNPNGDKPKEEPQPQGVPWLYDLTKPPSRPAVEKEHLGAWLPPGDKKTDTWPDKPGEDGWWRWWALPLTATPRPLTAIPVFQVSRVLSPAAKAGVAFDSIGAACAAIPEGKWGIIEIEDSGPFFEAPIHLTNRNLYLRGGNGFAPLIIWDQSGTRSELKPGKPAEAAPKDDVPAFLTVDKGTLLLDNVGFAVDWPDKVSGTGCLVRVRDGDLRAWATTFTVAGKPHGPMTAVRFEGGNDRRCRLSQCFARGARLTALDLPTAGADVMIDLSLLVTNDAPVLSVAAGKSADTASTLRVIRSTLVARDTVLQIRPSAEATAEPALHWLGWDVLMMRAAEEPGGKMVDLPQGAGPKGLTWRGVNCLYAGWETLLSGLDPISGPDNAKWHSTFSIPEWDKSEPHFWARGWPTDPFDALPITYQTAGTSVAFQATYLMPQGAAALNPQLLGAELLQLPWTRRRWVDISTQRARPSDPTKQEDAAPPIPQVADLLYHGERLDLDKVPDLGAYLHDLKQKPANNVVLHLHGTGKHKTRPVRVDGVNLFIYVEPAAKDAEPLVLEPDVSVAPDANAVFEVTHGTLWLVGVDVRCPDFKSALLPKYVVMVTDGHLLMTNSRLQGPLTQPPKDYLGLVHIQGTGMWQRENTYTLSIDQCVLLSAKYGLHLACAGLRVHMQNSLVLGTDRAVTIQSQTTMAPQKLLPVNPTVDDTAIAHHELWGEAYLNMDITADHCTFAGKESVFYLFDVPVKTDQKPFLWPTIGDPIVVQTKECAFINPFVDKENKAGAALLAYPGVAVPRGLLCWQADGNVYDKRLHAYAMSVSGTPPVTRLEKPQSFTTWERLWGPEESKPILDMALKETLDLEKLQLNLLALPAHPGLKEKPGADLKKLLERRQMK